MTWMTEPRTCIADCHLLCIKIHEEAMHALGLQLQVGWTCAFAGFDAAKLLSLVCTRQHLLCCNSSHHMSCHVQYSMTRHVMA
jgi:hypothetical protein